MPSPLCPRSNVFFGTFIVILVASHGYAGVTVRENAPLKELFELMAERMELAESVAKYKWEQRVAPDDDKSDPATKDAAIFKMATVNPKFMDSFCQAQLAAFKERQRQLFVRWKAAGTEGFDEVDDAIAAAKISLEKNTRDEVTKMLQLKGAFCPPITASELNDIAGPILKKHSLDKALFKPMLESIEMLAREDAPACRASRDH